MVNAGGLAEAGRLGQRRTDKRTNSPEYGNKQKNTTGMVHEVW